MTMHSGRRRRSNIQAVVGLFLVAWGLVFTASNFGLLPSGWVRWVFGLWPMALVVFGVGRLLSSDTVGGRVAGGLIALVGLAWTAEHLFRIQIHLWQWWPLLLVALGVILVARAWDSGQPAPGSGSPTPSSGREFTMFSGLERRISASDYRGTDLTAIMGGVDIDLRGSTTATGEAVIDLLVILGGVQIKVPPDWAVINEVTPIVGGVEDRSTGGKDAQHRLIVRGQVIVGGLEIGT